MFIGVITNIIVPDGKLKPFIKHIFSIFVLYTIVSPVFDMFNSANFNSVNSNFIYLDNLKQVETLEKNIQNEILDNGIKNVMVLINADVFNENFIINSVYVDISNVKSDKELSVDFVKEKISKIILNSVSVNVGDIVFYVWNLRRNKSW